MTAVRYSMYKLLIKIGRRILFIITLFTSMNNFEILSYTAEHEFAVHETRLHE